ncbi:MAG: hemolysin D, partial [Planctomycetia bacterium]|nr:hemolysin D [Planctomycetia bacterium]
MSTEQSIDPELIEQTKQQIRGLVNEIAQLSKQELPVEEFYGEFCSRVVSALAAIGGAIWTPGEGGGLELQYQINLRETKLAESQEQQIQHGRLLHKVFTGGEAMLVQPHSGYEGDEQAGNPTDFLLVLAALRSDDKVEGVVEVFQRPGARPTTQRGYLRFLLQMVELAGDYLKTRRLR